MLIPRARRDGLVVQELDGEVLVYDPRTGRAHCLNRPAALVWAAADGKASIDDVTRRVAAELDAAADETLVREALRRLHRAGLLGEAPPPWVAGTARRVALRRLALLTGGGWVLPAVTSLLAPGAAEAASCVPIDGPCTRSSQCCPNNQNIGCCRDGRCKNGLGGCAVP